MQDGIYKLDLYGTIAFSIAAVAAAIFPGPLRIPFAVLSCALFVVGTIAFLWAYGKAIERSRDQDVSVAMIFGMAGVVPKAIRRKFHLLTVAQSVVAITTAAIRPFTAQAFGILAIMLGIGCAGLWAATHGTFAERKDGRYAARKNAREATENG